MKKRIDELDIVKGIGIIYVFMRHLCELTGVSTYGEGFYSVFNSCTEAVMFMFVFLSGYVFKSRGSIGLDIKNKVKQLLVPYLMYCSFFTMTYLIRYVLLGDMKLGLFVRNVLSNFLAKPNLDIPALASGSNVMRYAVVPYWYIAEIFMAFMLFIVISKMIEKRKIYAKMISTVCLLACSSLLMYMDVRGILVDTFTSQVSYFTVVINIVGFAGLLMLGTIMREFQIFDMEARSDRFNRIMFAVCFIYTAIQIALYHNQYALQFGKWGQDGIWSVRITTLVGFALTYSLIFISYYLKRIHPLKRALSFLGANTLDILLLHFGIGELICMLFGFWVPIYDIAYPAEIFAWWHLVLVVVLTAVLVLGYINLKIRRKKKMAR